MTVPLLPQDMVEPRLIDPSTRELHVQAFTDAERIAFRLQWADESDEDVHGVASFTDACAVQLPRAAAADLPAPQMGESGKAVEMTYWRASWQAMVDGREDSVRALHPGAAVDHYPFEAPSLEKGSDEQLAMQKRYAPARKLENPMAGPRTQPVQDLVAEGPGTIRPAPASLSTGQGKYGNGGWAVVLARPLPDGLAAGTRTQAAFAVWQGSHGEAGARKMRSVWMPLLLEAKP